MRLHALFLCLATVAVPSVHAATPTHYFGFVRDKSFVMPVGRWDGSRWIAMNHLDTVPEPRQRVWLYGMTGPLDDVFIANDARASRTAVSWAWSGSISGWNEESQNYALAVLENPVKAVVAERVRLDDPEALDITRRWLKEHGQPVQNPYFLTDAFRLPDRSLLICAHAARNEWKTETSAYLYSLALLVRVGQITVLAHDLSFKPAGRSIDDQERLFGVQPYYRFVAVGDLNDDGKTEIVFYRSTGTETSIDLFPLEGRGRALLSTSTGY